MDDVRGHAVVVRVVEEEEQKTPNGAARTQRGGEQGPNRDGVLRRAVGGGRPPAVSTLKTPINCTMLFCTEWPHPARQPALRTSAARLRRHQQQNQLLWDDAEEVELGSGFGARFAHRTPARRKAPSEPS